MQFHETVIKLADGYIDEAIAILHREALGEESVHDIRVLMKRLRGLLRLYSDAGQREVVKELSPVLRDVARTFAAQRDSHVLAETLRDMTRQASKSVARQLREILQELEQQTADVQLELSPDRMAADLVWVRTVWHEKLKAVHEKDLLEALACYYRRNRRQGREALRLRDKTVLHDWRKRVKYFYYQLCALPPQKGVSYHEEMEALRLLGSLLGKVHDLDVLAAYLRTEGHENEPVRRLVAKRRVRLVKKIRRLYDELFFRSTRQFRKMIESA